MDLSDAQIRAALGFDDAQFALGLLYYDGTGVPRDRERAMRLFKRAADQGNANAAWSLVQHAQAEAATRVHAPTTGSGHEAGRAKSGDNKTGKPERTSNTGLGTNTTPMEWAPTEPTFAFRYTYAGTSSLRSASKATLRSAPNTPRRRLLNTERHALSLRFEHRCADADCRVLLPVGWHADHRIPLADGGADDVTNMQPLCPPCHMTKTAQENSRRQGPGRIERRRPNNSKGL